MEELSQSHQPPKTAIIAVQLILLAIVLALIVDLIGYIGDKVVASPLADSSGYTLLSDVVSYFIIMVLCVYFINQRMHWARLLIVCYAAFRLFLFCLSHTIVNFDAFLQVITLVYVAVLLIAFTLLFTPEINAWFSGKSIEALSEKSKPTTIAIVILIVSIVLFVTINAIAYTHFRFEKASAIPIPFNSPIALLIDTPIHLLVMIPVLIGLWYRKNWARIVLVVYVIARICFHFYSAPLVAYTAPFEMLVFLFFALNIVATTLLLCPESNQLFKGR